MALVFPPQFKDFPPLIFDWAVGTKLPSTIAQIDGFVGKYDEMVGDETITINADGGGNQLVTMTASEITGPLIRDKINTTGTLGTDGPGAGPVASFVDGKLKLQADTSIEVATYGTAGAPTEREAFERMGLPIVERDTVAAASASFEPDWSLDITRVDMISDNKLDLPSGGGANSFSAHVLVTPQDDDGVVYPARIIIGFFYELSDGSGASPFTSTLSGPIAQPLFDLAHLDDFEAVPNDADDLVAMPGHKILQHRTAPIGSDVLGPVSTLMGPFPVPNGVVAVRAFLGGVMPNKVGVSPLDEAILQVPAIPPLVAITGWAGSR